ncbi:TonB-dependent receptor [Thalassolituus sp. LLYu03]|uniref:TonB-dependent receptor n=1 Tax=Thalassolituus sp. LLYu03 TaxID=3421656 RepID=UPI003D2890BF
MKNSMTLNGFTRSALALAVSAAVPLTALAADEVRELPATQAQSKAEDSYAVSESTLPKYTQPLLDTAKTITVVPQSVMKDRNVDSLKDALRNVPGISLAAGEGGQPTGDSMSIRGFSARTDIMIDGVRDIAGYYRDTYNIEAVEVAKGPGSAVSGRGSTGGSINLQQKAAKLDAVNDVSLRLGTESDYRAQLDSNLVLGDTTALRVNLLTDDGDVAGRDEVYNSNDAIALAFGTGIGTDSRFSANVDYQKQDNMPDYGLPWVGKGSNPVAELADEEGKAPDVDYSNFYGNVYRDFEDITAQSLTLKYEKDLNDSTTLRVLGRTGTVERQSVVTAPRFYDIDTTTDVRQSDEKTRDTKDSLSVVQFDVIGRYMTGSIQHDVIAGVEVFSEKSERWNYDDNGTDNLDTTPVLVDLYNPDSHIAYNGHYSRGDKLSETKGDTSAVYAFDTLTLNEQWEVTAGLRYDTFNTEYYYQLNSDTDPKAKRETADNMLSWNAGVVYKPAKNGSVYFGAGNSFNPSAEGLTISAAQENVDPEETSSYELGTKWELLDGKAFASAALFRTEKDNARTTDPTTSETVLGGKQRVDGLELSVAGEITDAISVTAAYTYMDSEVLESGTEAEVGNELARTPKSSASFWGRYQITDKLAAGVGAQYMGQRYNSANITSREVAEEYMIFDMMVSYQVNDQWSVQMNGANLTDEEYIDQLGGGHGVPGEGRYLSLTTNFSF